MTETMSRPHQPTRRQFASSAIAAAGAVLLPNRILAKPVAATPAISPEIKTAPRRGEKVLWKVEPFPLSQVRLRRGPFLDAQEADHRYLHLLPVERLLHSFRVTAGLPSSAEPLGGWESPDYETRGSFAGHFLSACALMYSATGDDDLKNKGNVMVSELARCQKAFKNGYLSAFPEEHFDRLRDGGRVIAPFYKYHKIMAGLLDMYVHCGNEEALTVAVNMAWWVEHYLVLLC